MKRGHTTPGVATKICKAAQLLALGHTYKRIARHLGMKPEGLRGLRKRHRELWEAAHATAVKQVAKALRKQAGKRLTRLDDAFRAAEAVEKAGVSLFADPPAEVTQADGSQHTVPSFLERYLIPCRLVDASPETVNLYRIVVRKFAVCMGNPRLCEITNEMLVEYRDRLRGMQARGKKGRGLSVNTVRMYLQHLQGVLDKTGPAGPRNRDAAGFLGSVPYVKPPASELGEPKIVPDDLLLRCYEAAQSMQWPQVDFSPPADWWRALLMTARYLGLRSRTMFKLRMSMIDWDGRRLVIPAKILKGRKKLVLPLPDEIYQHLLAIRSDRELVFAWPHSLEWFRKCLHKLQVLAGVDVEQHFGLHGLRRTAITKLWKTSPAAAQLLAGHSSKLTTQMHYVNSEEVLGDAMRGSSVSPFTKQGGVA